MFLAGYTQILHTMNIAYDLMPLVISMCVAIFTLYTAPITELCAHSSCPLQKVYDRLVYFC